MNYQVTEEMEKTHAMKYAEWKKSLVALLRAIGPYGWMEKQFIREHKNKKQGISWWFNVVWQQIPDEDEQMQALYDEIANNLLADSRVDEEDEDGNTRRTVAERYRAMARTVERIMLRHRQWAAAIAKAGWTRSDDPSGHLYGSPGAHRTQWRQWLISPDLRAGEVEKLYDRLCRLIEEGNITRGWAIREFRRLRAHIPELYTEAHECRDPEDPRIRDYETAIYKPLLRAWKAINEMDRGGLHSTSSSPGPAPKTRHEALSLEGYVSRGVLPQLWALGVCT